jgi:hypothetical protein
MNRMQRLLLLPVLVLACEDLPADDAEEEALVERSASASELDPLSVALVAAEESVGPYGEAVASTLDSSFSIVANLAPLLQPLFQYPSSEIASVEYLDEVGSVAEELAASLHLLAQRAGEVDQDVRSLEDAPSADPEIVILTTTAFASTIFLQLAEIGEEFPASVEASQDTLNPGATLLVRAKVLTQAQTRGPALFGAIDVLSNRVVALEHRGNAAVPARLASLKAALSELKERVQRMVLR